MSQFPLNNYQVYSGVSTNGHSTTTYGLPYAWAGGRGFYTSNTTYHSTVNTVPTVNFSSHTVKTEPTTERSWCVGCDGKGVTFIKKDCYICNNTGLIPSIDKEKIQCSKCNYTNRIIQTSETQTEENYRLLRVEKSLEPRHIRYQMLADMTDNFTKTYIYSYEAVDNLRTLKKPFDLKQRIEEGSYHISFKYKWVIKSFDEVNGYWYVEFVKKGFDIENFRKNKARLWWYRGTAISDFFYPTILVEEMSKGKDTFVYGCKACNGEGCIDSDVYAKGPCLNCKGGVYMSDVVCRKCSGSRYEN